MPTDERRAPLGPEQAEVLEELIRRARRLGVRTGVRDDEIADLDEAEAGELIEQLRRRLGEAQG